MEDFLSRTHGQVSVESTAGRWLKIHPPEPGHQLAVALILKPDYEYSSGVEPSPQGHHIR